MRVAGLRALTFLAYNELKRVKEFALKTLDQSMGKKKTESQLLDTVFKRGTILSCPKCGEGLYKVTARSTTEKLVMDDGKLLAPLNETIPPRGTWTPLVCPLCDERLFQQGQLHIFQDGWQ